MSDWPQNIVSGTPEKYQFKLVSVSDEIICNPEPMEWKSGTLEFKRDLENGGVFVSFVCDSLTFVGNGATFLRNLFDVYGLNAKCTLIISWWKNFDFTTPANGRQYIEFPTRYDINFNFYESVKVGRFFFGVRVKAVNNSVQTKLDNRQDVDVDITKLVSIGGVTINGYGANDVDLKKKLYYTATNINYGAELNKNMEIDGNYPLKRKPGADSYTTIPLDIITNQYSTEIYAVPFLAQITDIKLIPPFFSAKFDHTFDIKCYFRILVTRRHIGTFPWAIEIIETDPNGATVNTTVVYEFGGLNQYYSYYDTVYGVTVTAGNDLKLVVLVRNIEDIAAFMVNQQIMINESISSSPATQTEGFPVYEAIERIGQHILDVQYPVYTDFFGRTDVNYKDGTKYAAENVLRFAHIQNGMNQRGLTLANTDNPLVLNFKDLFASLKALWNVGYSIETNYTLFGDYLPRIRIEDYAHFFQDVEIVFDPPISSRISKYDIQSQVMPELVPVDIKSGFDSFEYLSVNGRSEPNTTNQRTSIMGTSTKFENISPIRGDTKGILDNLSNPVNTSDGSTDTKGDSDNFIIKTRKDTTAGHDWKPEKAELITVIDDTSLFKEDLMNRYFTPTRMLLRHGNRISAGMTRADAQASNLTFQKSDKYSSLITSDDAGVTELAENADILVSTLVDPIFLPMKHTISVDFTNADLEVLQLNQLGYIDFGLDLKGNSITGFLLNLKKKNAGGKADITIIERNIILS